MEDRSELFRQLQGFSQRKLKKVETKVVTASGEQLVEKRGAKGLQVLSDGAKEADKEQPTRKLDLQVGFIVPGLLIGSQDVAHDKKSLDSYGITHILNLDSEVENKFEDDFNYKNINMEDRQDFALERVLDDCYDFIDDGRHYGNVLVHCSGTIGLSRSTTICVAYLMSKEKQKFSEALNNVKEVRSFVKPNEGFMKQLQEYETKLRGAQEIKDSGIDDPFALRKKQEIEQEKAMVAGAASVKNRMKMFGATLDTSATPSNRSKSVSPSPYQKQQQQPPHLQSNQPSSPASSKWSSSNNNNNMKSSTTSSQPEQVNKSISKSMTPEPRKSWQQQPPPPPPPPPGDLFSDLNKSSKLNSTSSAPPPPPPMPPAGSLQDSKPPRPSGNTQLPPPPPPPPTPVNHQARHQANQSQSQSYSQSQDSIQQSSDNQRMVFGRVRPPPMKIVGGMSIEKHDPVSDRTSGLGRTNTQQPKSSLQLPLKKQITSDSGSESETGTESARRSPSPSAALRAAKQQVAAQRAGDPTTTDSNDRAPQLNRSSTKKLLNLIKTKTKTDLTLKDGDEDDEIEALLGALENESIENIDWDELGLDEDEVKGIIANASDDSSEDSSESEQEDEDQGEEEIEEEEEEVETSTQHFILRSK